MRKAHEAVPAGHQMAMIEELSGQFIGIKGTEQLSEYISRQAAENVHSNQIHCNQRPYCLLLYKTDKLCTMQYNIPGHTHPKSGL